VERQCNPIDIGSRCLRTAANMQALNANSVAALSRKRHIRSTRSMRRFTRIGFITLCDRARVLARQRPNPNTPRCTGHARRSVPGRYETIRQLRYIKSLGLGCSGLAKRSDSAEGVLHWNFALDQCGTCKCLLKGAHVAFHLRDGTKRSRRALGGARSRRLPRARISMSSQRRRPLDQRNKLPPSRGKSHTLARVALRR
jgi:hypothetical protein